MQTSFKNRRTRLMIVSILLAGSASSVAQAQSMVGNAPIQPSAQTPPEQAEPAGLGDIIVTAQRRSENLQKVPIVVAAVDSAALTAAGVDNVESLNLVVPGLQVNNANGYSNPHLRGVGTTAVGAGFENPIATYVDGVYYAAAPASLLSFNNIEQIAVLKGPQGTLFGRNATGGLIQVTTREPTDFLSGRANVSYGNYSTVQADGYLAGGLTDDLKADIALLYSDQGNGYGRNLANGRDVYKTTGNFAARSKWVFKPGPDTKITAIGDYSRSRNSQSPAAQTPGTYAFPGFPITQPIGYPSPWDVSLDTQPLVKIKSYGGSLRIDQKVGKLDILSVTAYRNSDFGLTIDLDATSQFISYINVAQTDRQLSQELQLQSNNTPIKWVVGAFYFNAKAKNNPVDVFLSPNPALNPAFPVGTIRTVATQGTDSISGFGQATAPLTDRLNLTLGIRYTREKRDLEGSQVGLLLVPGGPVPIATVPQRNLTFNNATYRAALDYNITNKVMVYGSISSGFKSGGFNPGTIAEAPYKPEKLTAYEVGVKSQFFDNKVRLNGAVFYYDYQDLQVQRLLLSGSAIINGSARIYGLDVDLEAAASDRLTLRAGAEALNAKFTDFPNAPLSNRMGGVPLTTFQAKGNRIPFSPDFVANVAADYTVPVGDGSIKVNGTAYFSDGWFIEPDNLLSQPSFWLLNSSITWMPKKDRGLSFSIWGRNLTNEAVIANAQTAPLVGTHTQSLQPPRTYGATVGFSF